MNLREWRKSHAGQEGTKMPGRRGKRTGALPQEKPRRGFSEDPSDGTIFPELGPGDFRHCPACDFMVLSPDNDWLKFFRQVENTSSDWLIMSFKSIVKEDAAIEKNLSDTVRHSPSFLPTVLNAEKNYQYLRTLICHVKSEWKANDSLTKEYYRGMDSQKSNMEKVRKEVCFWDDAKGAASGCKEVKFPSSDTNYYFQPLAFLEHLRKVTNFDINPYKGKSVVYWNKDGSYENRNATGNPGAVPKDTARSSSYIWGSDHYAIITGSFNDDYANEPDTKERYATWLHFYHEGVDFRGASKDPIYSLIFGKILAYGWFGEYGQSVFIANTRGKGIYLLAHLSSYASGLEINKLIVPGEIIGKVGGSGRTKTEERAMNAFNPHLHVTYYDYQYIEGNDIVSQMGDEIVWGILADYVVPNRRNPLFHGESETRYPNSLK